MERKKYLLLILLLSVLEISAVYARTSYREQIYQAYITGDMEHWKQVLDEMEILTFSSADQQLELIHYYYGYIAFLLNQERTKEAKTYIEKGEKLIREVLKEQPESGEAHAFKGSYGSFKIAINKIKAVTLGPESMKQINKAYKLDPTNVQVVADKANLLYYTPGIIGGNKKEAINLYKRAISLMKEKNETEKNWFYLNLLTLLGQHAEADNDLTGAAEYYRKALSKEPGFKWVKEDLHPDLLRKLH
ncbi:MAG: hypothetical protein LUD15_00530 [Bacteroides sp.]|nr:hypothetical protein [Bacteroides sp.]